MEDSLVQRIFNFQPAHHKTDPATSKLAEDAITASGARLTQAQKVLGLVKRHTGLTSAEYTKVTTLDRYAIARRLPDLEHNGCIRKGIVRQCGISHKPAVTWWFVKEQDSPT